MTRPADGRRRSLLQSALATAAIMAMGVPTVAQAQEAPQRGGTLTHAVEVEPNTLDCHASATSFTLLLVAPHYSTLLRFDPNDHQKIVGDLAQSWTVSDDGLSYTFKLRPNVRFHDGTTLTSEDIRATYERLRKPPEGVTSARQVRFQELQSIATPDPLTVVFRMATRNPGMEANFASPWNCVYSAKKLAQKPNYPATEPMGTGPFVFVENSPGSHMSARRFDDYFDKGKPYLDGIRAVFIKGPGVVNAIAGGQVDGTFFLLAPPDADRIKSTRGEGVQILRNYISVLQLAVVNTRKAPFSDPRVRQALNMAIDRKTGEMALSKITMLGESGTIVPPNSRYLPPKDQMEQLPGLGRDIKASREAAKKLLAEAGVPNLKLTLLNRPIRHPWEPAAIFLVDQWRQIGVEAKVEALETGAYFAKLKDGSYDVALDFNNITTDEPSEALFKYVPGNPSDYTGFADPELTELYRKASTATTDAARKDLIAQFQKRLWTNSNVLPMFWGQRIVALDSKVRGWKVPPSTIVNLDMANVWKAK